MSGADLAYSELLRIAGISASSAAGLDANRLEQIINANGFSIDSIPGLAEAIQEIIDELPEGGGGGGEDVEPINPFLVYSGGEYPERSDVGIPVIFVGPVNPDSLGLMLVGDAWFNNGLDDNEDAPVYITSYQLQEAVSSAFEGFSLTLSDMQDQIDEIESNPGPSGMVLLPVDFSVPVTGDTSELMFLPLGSSEIFQPYVQAADAPVGGSVVLDLEADDGLGFSSILDDTLVLEAGENYLEGTVPTTQVLSAGARLRWKIISAPVEEANELSRVGTVGTTNSGVNSVSNITMNKPSGAVTGDLLIAVVWRQNQTLTYSSDWEPILDFATNDVTAQGRLAVLRAINSPTLSMAVGLSSGSPVLSAVMGFSGADTQSIDGPTSTPSTFAGNNAGNVVNLPSYDVGNVTGGDAEASERVILIAGSRHGAADEGRLHDWTGTGLSLITDLDTSRGSGNADLHLSIQEVSTDQVDEAVISGATVGNVAGSSFTSWCLAVVGIREGLSAGSAGDLNLQVNYRPGS